MPVRLEDYLTKLSPEKQSEIARQTAALIEKEATLNQLREARARFQHFSPAERPGWIQTSNTHGELSLCKFRPIGDPD